MKNIWFLVAATILGTSSNSVTSRAIMGSVAGAYFQVYAARSKDSRSEGSLTQYRYKFPATANVTSTIKNMSTFFFQNR